MSLAARNPSAIVWTALDSAQRDQPVRLEVTDGTRRSVLHGTVLRVSVDQAAAKPKAPAELAQWSNVTLHVRDRAGDVGEVPVNRVLGIDRDYPRAVPEQAPGQVAVGGGDEPWYAR